MSGKQWDGLPVRYGCVSRAVLGCDRLAGWAKDIGGTLVPRGHAGADAVEQTSLWEVEARRTLALASQCSALFTRRPLAHGLWLTTTQQAQRREDAHPQVPTTSRNIVLARRIRRATATPHDYESHLCACTTSTVQLFACETSPASCWWLRTRLSGRRKELKEKGFGFSWTKFASSR